MLVYIIPIKYLFNFVSSGRTSNVLREATVNVIGNIDCSSYLNGNTTDNAIKKAKVRQTLPNGINAQLICSTGIKNETTGIYTVGNIVEY